MPWYSYALNVIIMWWRNVREERDRLGFVAHKEGRPGGWVECQYIRRAVM